MSAVLADSPDDVSIVVGSTAFKGWQTVSVSRSCESMPNSFSLTASAQFLQGDALSQTRPGQACKIYIGSDLVITGWIDRRSISVDARNHQLTLTGRGLTRNLVDCSVDFANDPKLGGGQVPAPNTLALASRLSAAYGVTCISAVSDLGIKIDNLQVQLGETPYGVIESVARYAGYLVYEDAYGRLVLDRVGKNKMASGFTMPGNIEAISIERSVDQRFSQYIVVTTSINGLAQFGGTNVTANVLDPTMPEHRVKITVSNQTAPGYDIAQAMANWDKARRIGRSQAAQITCDSWRDQNNQLWTPNYLALIDAAGADITGNANWIIGSVTLRKDMSGTHADLILMPPDAFNPEPNPLNLFNNELVNAPRKSQDPAPPTTSAPVSGG